MRGTIFTLNDRPLKLVDKFTYLISNVSSTESDDNICLAKAWTAVNRLSIIWKSDLSNQIKRDFFKAVAVSILLCGCTMLMLTKYIEKKNKWELFKNATQCFEQIFYATLHKTGTVW